MPTAALEPPAPELGHAEEALISAIREARRLSADLGLEWVQWFDKALIADPEVPYHPDILPPRWPRAAQRWAARAM